MLAAPPVMTGADGLRIYGLPGDRLVAAMKKYGRMGSSGGAARAGR